MGLFDGERRAMSLATCLPVQGCGVSCVLQAAAWCWGRGVGCVQGL